MLRESPLHAGVCLSSLARLVAQSATAGRARARQTGQPSQAVHLELVVRQFPGCWEFSLHAAHCRFAGSVRVLATDRSDRRIGRHCDLPAARLMSPIMTVPSGDRAAQFSSRMADNETIDCPFPSKIAMSPSTAPRIAMQVSPVTQDPTGHDRGTGRRLDGH